MCPKVQRGCANGNARGSASARENGRENGSGTVRETESLPAAGTGKIETESEKPSETESGSESGKRRGRGTEKGSERGCERGKRCAKAYARETGKGKQRCSNTSNSSSSSTTEAKIEIGEIAHGIATEGGSKTKDSVQHHRPLRTATSPACRQWAWVPAPVLAHPCMEEVQRRCSLRLLRWDHLRQDQLPSWAGQAASHQGAEEVSEGQEAVAEAGVAAPGPVEELVEEWAGDDTIYLYTTLLLQLLFSSADHLSTVLSDERM